MPLNLHIINYNLFATVSQIVELLVNIICNNISIFRLDNSVTHIEEKWR